MPKILIVDDEWLTRVEIEGMLTDLGYAVVGQAETGVEAVDMVPNLEPDLVIMDVMMPGEMNGIDAARVIKAEWGTPIIFVTGFGDPEYIEAAKEISPFGYVMKPFDEKEIHASVEIALSKRELEVKLEKTNRRLERTNLDLQEEILTRKKTEVALRDSQAYYQALFDQSPDGIAILNPETGKPIEFNEQVCRQVGYSREEFSQLRLSDIELKETAEETQRHIRKVMDEGSDDFETILRTKNGEARHVNVRAQKIKTARGNFLLAILRDITERKQAEESLRENEEMLQTIAASALDSIFCKNINRQYTYVNKSMIQLLDSRREDLIGKTPEEVFDENEAAIVNEVDARTLSGEKVSEVRSLSIAGRQYTFHTIQVPLRDADGKITGISGIVRDITENKQE